MYAITWQLKRPVFQGLIKTGVFQAHNNRALKIESHYYNALLR